MPDDPSLSGPELRDACEHLWSETGIMLQTGIEEWPGFRAADLLQVREASETMGTGFILHEGSYAPGSVLYNVETGKLVAKTVTDGSPDAGGSGDGGCKSRCDSAGDGDGGGDGACGLDGLDGDGPTGVGENANQKNVKRAGVPYAHTPRRLASPHL
jgi:hypothetical protein